MSALSVFFVFFNQKGTRRKIRQLADWHADHMRTSPWDTEVSPGHHHLWHDLHDLPRTYGHGRNTDCLYWGVRLTKLIWSFWSKMPLWRKQQTIHLPFWWDWTLKVLKFMLHQIDNKQAHNVCQQSVFICLNSLLLLLAYIFGNKLGNPSITYKTSQFSFCF